MTIKDILSQIQPPARASRMSGKSTLHEEKDAEPKGLANFEALVREMDGKAEKRSSRISQAQDVHTDEEKSERKEADPLFSLVAQAVPALVPFFVRQVEAEGLSEDAGSFNFAPKGKDVRADRGDEIDLDEVLEDQAGDVKADALKQPAEKASPSVARQASDRPASEATPLPDIAAEAPVADGESTALPRTEVASSQATANDKPEASSQPDIPPARGSEAGNGDRMAPNTPSSGGGVSAPAVATAPVAKPVQQALHIANVEIISERSNGVARTLSIRLQPEDLGMVTARLRLVPEGMQVELIADKRETAERLAADRDLLGKALQSAGLGDNAVVAITVSERASPNMAGGQTGQQNLPAQDQSGGRNGPQAQMQGEGNGNRGEQRGNWMEQEQQGGSLAAVDAPQTRRLSRGLVV